jgi:hypothetical protein
MVQFQAQPNLRRALPGAAATICVAGRLRARSAAESSFIRGIPPLAPSSARRFTLRLRVDHLDSGRRLGVIEREPGC